MVLLPWIVVALLALRPESRQPPHGAVPDAADPLVPQIYDEYIHQCHPGPWGELQYSRILIEPPDDFVTAQRLEPQPIQWVFKGHTPAGLQVLWTTAGLNPAQQRLLEDPARRTVSPDAIVVRPPEDLVLNLGADSRAAIYAVLSSFAENPNQNEPFRFRADAVDEWFDRSNLKPEILALVRRMLYRRGNSALFSDHDLVLPLLRTRAERLQLIATLARKSTLLVKLRVLPTSDIETLTNYWGHGPRSKDIGPLLLSISHRPRGITLDIAHLLTRFARARIFTYPQPADHPDDITHDCHWTSLNFFNDPPDERFADAAVVKTTLERDYTPVVGRPAFGDIFVFALPDGKVIHSCVFIADDIVFTKNGASNTMPWMLMNLQDVIAYYPADPPLTIRAFRRRDL